jgi:hypothetical protein
VVGSIVYYLVIGRFVAKMPTDLLKLLTAVIVAIFLAVPFSVRSRRVPSSRREIGGAERCLISVMSENLQPGTDNEKKPSAASIPSDEGDYLTVIGSNGAGTSRC